MVWSTHRKARNHIIKWKLYFYILENGEPLIQFNLLLGVVQQQKGTMEETSRSQPTDGF